MPIPLVFDLEDNYFNLEYYIDNRYLNKNYTTIYSGWWPTDSIKMYLRLLLNKINFTKAEINFKMPGTLPGLVEKLLNV